VRTEHESALCSMKVPMTTQSMGGLNFSADSPHSFVKVVWALLQSSNDANYIALREKFRSRRTRQLLWCVAVVYPLFAGLDAVVYPEHLELFAGFRAVNAGLALFVLLHSSRRWSDARLARAALALGYLATACVSVMAALGGGFQSNYLVGVLLCMLCVATLEVCQPRGLAVYLVTSSLIYIAACAQMPFRIPDLVAALFFTTGGAFFCLICSLLLEHQRRELFDANTALLHRNEELERARQHQRRFLSTISHELRSPINAVLGFSELIVESAEGLDKRSRENLMRIQRSSRHLLGIVNDLLDLAKAEAGCIEITLESFDLVPLLHEVAEETRALVGQRDVTVSVDAPAACRVRADSMRLRQILLNLLGNAAKFTFEGEIGLRAWVERGAVWLEVSDTGIGIAEENRGLIFEAFRQVDGRASGGTGLGLSIVNNLVALLHGRIELESEPDRGSTFRIRFEGMEERSAA
jgi:signal transduction histidine kinase